MKRLAVFVPLVGVLSLAGAVTAVAQATAGDALARGRMYVQVAVRLSPRVHVLRQREPNFAGVVGNVTVIEQRDAVVLIDAGASHGSGERIVQQVRSITPKPVSAVVLTHWHGDHVMGLSAILAAWPGAAVIAHSSAAADIEKRLSALFPLSPSSAYELEHIKSLRAAYADIEKNQAAQAATDAERKGWQTALANLELRLADVPGTHLVSATRTLTDTLTLPDPVNPVVLQFLGRANTDGDIVAWLPRDRILVAGDVVVAPTPYMIQVFPRELAATLASLRAMPFRVLVPGHGAPQRDRLYLDKLTALVATVRDRVTPLARAGVPLDSIPLRADFARERKTFAGSDAWLAYWFDLYGLSPLIESVFNEALGRPLGPTPR